MQIGSEHMRALMTPRGVALVGATTRAGSVGAGILSNLLSREWSNSNRSAHLSAEPGRNENYPHLLYKIFPVNPGRSEVCGFKCYKSVLDIGQDTQECDLGIICVPAKACPEAIRDCGKIGSIRAVVVIAAGFKEIGSEGLLLEQECVSIAKSYNIALTGPNCLGTQSPNYALNASFAASNANPGHIAFISQSGAICTAILDWTLGMKTTSIGFSAFISLGSMAHTEWADWITYCGEDPSTDAIVMYMETVGDANRFIQAAQCVAPNKPIIILKAGKSEQASVAAASHTGSLTGAFANFQAAMDRAGCLVVDTIDDLQNLIYFLSCLSNRKRSAKAQKTRCRLRELSDQVVVVTNAGGPGVICADALEEAGLTLHNPLPPTCIDSLNAILPSAWSHNNPIDILGDADELRFDQSIRKISDAFAMGPHLTLMVILSPQSVTKPLETAEVLVQLIEEQTGPGDPFVICAWMGGPQVQRGREILQFGNVPVFAQPDVAARVLGLLRKQRRLAEGILPIRAVSPNEGARTFIKKLKAQHKDKSSEETLSLSEHDSKTLLRFYGVHTTGSVICLNESEIDKAIDEVGGLPVVLKVHGGKFSHKSDIGGVVLDIKTLEAAVAAFSQIRANYEALDPHGFEGVTVQPMIGSNGTNKSLTKHAQSPELLLGCVLDPQFGPMIMFGTGGTYVEIFNDTAITLCPLSSPELAANLVKKTAISRVILTTAAERLSHGCSTPVGDNVAFSDSNNARASEGHSTPASQASQRYAKTDEQDLYNTIVRFSDLCADLKEELLECEMNPLVITQDNTLLALDARFILRV